MTRRQPQPRAKSGTETSLGNTAAAAAKSEIMKGDKLGGAACLSPKAAAAALSPKLVSLHDFAFGCRCRLVSQACLPS